MSNTTIASLVLALLVVDVAAVLGMLPAGLAIGAGVAGSGMALAMVRRRLPSRLRRHADPET